MSTPQFEKPYGSPPADSDHALTADQDEFARSPGQKRNKKLITFGILGGAVVVIVLAVVLPVYFLVIKPQQLNSTGGGSSPSTGGSTGGGGGGTTAPNTPPASKFTGGDGSEVTMEDGTKFTYSNKFGGYWYDNPADPFNNYARPQADIPPLNETWKWGVDMIQGCVLFSTFFSRAWR